MRASNSESFLEIFERLSNLQGSLTFAIYGWMLYAFFDSTEDCRYESVTMMEVYRNSHCNIAAADASYSEQGCFFYRDLSLIPPITVETRWNNFARNRSYHVHPSTSWTPHLEKSPLNRRAWVVPRAYLSFSYYTLQSRAVILGVSPSRCVRNLPRWLSATNVNPTTEELRLRHRSLK